MEDKTNLRTFEQLENDPNVTPGELNLILKEYAENGYVIDPKKVISIIERAGLHQIEKAALLQSAEVGFKIRSKMSKEEDAAQYKELVDYLKRG